MIRKEDGYEEVPSLCCRRRAVKRLENTPAEIMWRYEYREVPLNMLAWLIGLSSPGVASEQSYRYQESSNYKGDIERLSMDHDVILEEAGRVFDCLLFLIFQIPGQSVFSRIRPASSDRKQEIRSWYDFDTILLLNLEINRLDDPPADTP